MNDFEEVYTRYMKDVYRFVLKLSRDEDIAEEITQETFFKALHNIDRFKGQCKFRVWLCQIAQNTYFNFCEKQKTQRKLQTVNEEAQPGCENRLLQKEAIFEIHKKLHELPEPYKEVFSLRVLGELSFLQISELFGKSESWARVTFYRAKLKMKEEMK